MQVYDRLLETRSTPPDYESPVVLITVNESDLRRFGYPISDTLLATALVHLENIHPRSIGIDIFRDLQLSGRDQLASVLRSCLVKSDIGCKCPKMFHFSDYNDEILRVFHLVEAAEAVQIRSRRICR